MLLVDREVAAAEETLAEIEAEGGTASVFRADVTNASDCAALADAAVERYGALHVLFNNVGISGPGSPTTVEEEVWDRVLDVNLKSMMLTTKYVVPKMIESGGGSIINVSSIVGLRAGSGAASIPYAASKRRHHRNDRLNGGASGAGQYTGELPGAGASLHTDGGRPDVRGDARPAPPGRAARHRGQRLGYCLGQRIPRQRRVPLD